MANALIPFRNGLMEVSYRDYGHEYDTGAHVIEWDFLGYSQHEDAPANTQNLPFDAESITEGESNYIDEAVREIALGMRDDD